MSIELFLDEKYPGEGRRKLYREELARVCNAFIQSGHADSKFEVELTSGFDSKFWSCLSEALIFQRLGGHQISQKPKGGAGPDFLITHNNSRIWIEVICPQPLDVPQEWLKPEKNVVGSVPHNAILLRWTSAIKEKIEKLIGNGTGNNAGYLHSGIVANNDIYVIAVNGCQHRHGPFDALHGISQLPYAAEAVFPIGPLQISIDKTTLKTVGTGHQVRITIPKPNGACVPTHAFLDPNNHMVSAIWAVDFNCGSVVGNSEPSALIHNPNATNPLPVGLLTAGEEYVTTPGPGSNEYTFSRIS